MLVALHHEALHLRANLIATKLAFLLDEADVEASTPAEETNFRELNRILGIWINRPRQDNQACYHALKINLKARNGAIPETCR